MLTYTGGSNPHSASTTDLAVGIHVQEESQRCCSHRDQRHRKWSTRSTRFAGSGTNKQLRPGARGGQRGPLKRPRGTDTYCIGSPWWGSPARPHHLRCSSCAGRSPSSAASDTYAPRMSGGGGGTNTSTHLPAWFQLLWIWVGAAS